MAKHLDKFVTDADDFEKPSAERLAVAGMIENQAFAGNRNPFDPDGKAYEFDESYKPWKKGEDPRTIHTVPDMVRYMKENKDVEIDARVFHVGGDRKARMRKMGRDKFLEAFKSRKTTFRENIDAFQYDMEGGGSQIGSDSLPLIGGPFTKQLYYTDYIKTHLSTFYAYHHDPLARRFVNVMKHFTLGKGFSVDCDDKRALILWDAFVEVNNYMRRFKQLALELPTYGEIMQQWMPNNAKFFTWQLPDKEIPKGMIPRVRLVDPSTIWEVITYPEDIERVIAYQQIFPTQWQMYTAKGDGDTNVPSTKFIYQQIPAADMYHFRVNSMSNEKRGRSELFPILSYLKRIRDLANYSLVREMKDAAWCLDTTIKGNATDLAAYMASQQQLGTIPHAGSEFIHTDKIEREYRGAEGTSRAASNVWDWAISMCCIGTGIPFSYLGTHQHGGSTRASAIVATEPVAKLFEDRQSDYEEILLATSRRLFDLFGLKNARLEITFPEIITQDRSAKLKDLALAESQGWITKHRAAEIAAKELGISDYDYEDEQLEINSSAPVAAEPDPSIATPLTNPKPSGLSGQEKSGIKNNDRQ
jgi:hypothetical protein